MPPLQGAGRQVAAPCAASAPRRHALARSKVLPALCCPAADKNYRAIKEAWDKYHDYGFEVLAFPCNQVGRGRASPGTCCCCEAAGGRQLHHHRQGGGLPHCRLVACMSAGQPWLLSRCPAGSLPHRRAGPPLLAPSLQFGGQEPGEAAQIESFVVEKYAVGFPLMAKVEVNGPSQHPVFAWLKAHSPAGPGACAGSRAEAVPARVAACSMQPRPVHAALLGCLCHASRGPAAGTPAADTCMHPA